MNLTRGAAVSTAILMPLLAPLLIPGPTLSRWDIGRPLLTIPQPLVVWLALARFFASRAGATRQESAA